MSIRVSLPGGVTAETDTVSEAMELLGALRGQPPKEPPGRFPRTRLLVTNGDVKTLEEWGLEHEEVREAMEADDWLRLARELRRTVAGAANVVRRYAWGVYECSGSDPAAYAVVHAEKDRSRAKPQG